MLMARPYHPAPPFQAPMSGTLDERLANIATELNRKANQGVQGTAQHFLALIAPDGSTYRVLVDDAGALHTELVPRT
jgi:hypothetical protein